jgi:uncharacterized protein YndB with AHSA1/START domain
VKFEVRTTFPANIDRVFECLVYSADCEKWMEFEDWNGLTLLLHEGKFAGFETPNPTPTMESLVFELEKLVRNERVIYKPSKATHSNTLSQSMTFFPFREMKQAMYFRTSGSGCEVLHIVELVPKGIIGWFTCNFIVKPSLISSLHTANKKLAEYLNT